MKINSFISKKLISAAFVLLIVVCFWSRWNYAQKRFGFDFYQFWAVGHEVRLEKNINIYSDEGRKRLGLKLFQTACLNPSLRLQRVSEKRKVFETYSTPFLYALFGSLTPGNYDEAYLGYQFLCMSLMLWSVLKFSQWSHFPFAAGALFFAVLSFSFAPYLSDLRVANVNQVQLGLLTLYLCLRKRQNDHTGHFLGGLVLGALVLFKPNLLFVALVLSFSRWIKKQHKKLVLEWAGILVSAFLAFIFSSLFFGSGLCWLGWLKAGFFIPKNIATVAMGNFSLSRLLFDRFDADITYYLMSGLTALTVLCFWIGHKRNLRAKNGLLYDEFHEEMLAAGTGCLIYLLSASLVWLHYYLLALPSVFILLSPVPGGGNFRFGRFFAGSLAFLCLLLVAPLKSLLGPEAIYTSAALTITGAGSLFILMLLECAHVDVVSTRTRKSPYSSGASAA